MAFLPALMWAVLIAVLSVVAGLRLPAVRVGGIGPDKLAHFGVYAVLAVLLAWGFSRQHAAWPTIAASVFILLAGFGFGALMEGLQAWFVPERSFEYADMAANAFGIFAGWMASLFIFK